MTSAESSEPSEDKPKKKLGSTALRFASALPLIPLVVWLLFWAPKYGFQIWGLAWIIICVDELMRMAVPGSWSARIWGALATTGVYGAFLFLEHPAALPGVLVALAIGGLVVSLISPDPIERGAQRAGWLMAGPVYIAGTLGCLILLHGREDGGAWVLLSMFAAFLSDTGAYFTGRALGKTKLSRLSPKKTVEGSVGGVISGMIGAAVLQHFLLKDTLPMVDAVVLGGVAAALGQAGDLLESLLKRATGVKDSGNIMPGHGGLLDRSDALMFTGATVWLYVTFVLPLR